MAEQEQGQEEKRRGVLRFLLPILAVLGAVIAFITLRRRRRGEEEGQ